jgi:hypothetical protein
MVAQLVFQFKIWVFKESNDAEVYRIRFNYIYRGMQKERGGVIFEKLVDKHAIKQEKQNYNPKHAQGFVFQKNFCTAKNVINQKH